MLQEQGHRHVGEHDDLELQRALVADDGDGTPVPALCSRGEVVVVESREVKGGLVRCLDMWLTEMQDVNSVSYLL